MYQVSIHVLHDTNNVTDSGCTLCQCRSLIKGCWQCCFEFRTVVVFPGSLNSNTDIVIAMIVADTVKLTQSPSRDSVTLTVTQCMC